jgi:hypothetical protein
MPESIPIWEKEYGSVNRTWATCDRQKESSIFSWSKLRKGSLSFFQIMNRV